MKLADKKFLMLEVLMLIGSAVSSGILTSSLQLFTVFFFPCLIGTIMAWKLQQDHVWWKLAGKLLFFASVILIIELFGLVRIWHDLDDGAYLTGNEMVGIILLLWAVHAPVLIGCVSFAVFRLRPKKI